jgi:hypothetical protein
MSVSLQKSSQISLFCKHDSITRLKAVTTNKEFSNCRKRKLVLRHDLKRMTDQISRQIKEQASSVKKQAF